MTRFVILLLSIVFWASISAAQTQSSHPPGAAPSGEPIPGSVPADPTTGTSRSPVIPGGVSGSVGVEPPGATRPAADRQPAPRPVPGTPQFSKLLPACVGLGEVVLLSGEQFSEIFDFSAYLESKNKQLKLQLISKNSRQMVLKLPVKGLLAGASYPLILKKSDGSQIKTNLSVRICNGVDQLRADEDVDLLLLGPTAIRDAVAAELNKKNIAISEEYDLNGLGQFLMLIRPSDMKTVVDDLEAQFPSLVIDINGSLDAAGISSPRLYARQSLAWPKASECGLSFDKLKVGLLDGQIDQSHPTFANSLIHNESFLDKSNVADLEHATAIASLLVGAQPNRGLRGLLPKASLYSGVVLRRDQDGGTAASVKAIVRGLDWLLVNKVRLIDISLATIHSNGILKQVILTALDKGALIFAAVGNFGADAGAAYPAAEKGVFAVTAVDAANNLYNQANTGPFVGFSAPGVDIWTAIPGGTAAYQSGTSFAAPHALAIAALYLNKNPSLSRAILEKVLLKTVKPLGGTDARDFFGAGLLQGSC